MRNKFRIEYKTLIIFYSNRLHKEEAEAKRIDEETKKHKMRQ